ncbi:MAG: HAD hydrolase family protein [Bacteroidota bacterium]
MNNLEKFREIHTMIFDVDGVMTNSQLIILENGRLLRKMSTRDSYAIRLAVEKGYNLAVITKGKSSGVMLRLRDLGFMEVYDGVDDKLDTFEEFTEVYDLDRDGILYMGDDLPDYEVMKQVGMACCPADAAHEIKAIAHYISPIKGGEGCVRDVIEKVLTLQNNWIWPGQRQLDV